MLSLKSLTNLLGYAGSEWFRTRAEEFEPESAQLFRMATEREGENFHVEGIYVLKTTGTDGSSLAPRPAVCVAEAPTADDARKLHRRVWNLGNIPFLIVNLPDEVRVYCGFRYEQKNDAGLILSESSGDKKTLGAKLADFTADSVDSARIWQAQRKHLETGHRVDSTLLENLKHLAQALDKHCVPALNNLELAHALIGKFVYLRYLRDRNILDDNWLAERQINPALVFGPTATVAGLAELVTVLEARFNGDIFHIDFGSKCPLTDAHVQLVASVLGGDDVRVTETGGVWRQLHLNFQAFDFRHIPVEMLSSIYEQFLHAQKKGKSDGAYYTPEVLADYLLSEINSVRALRPGMTVCDPACGSGIFLVLAYRRLIELELRKTKETSGSLSPVRLSEILRQSIYGVERQQDACNVTVFSLILTLLHYAKPPELHANAQFKFPSLLNKHIFCDDFFNPNLALPNPEHGFDIIAGNPPWIELKPVPNREKDDEAFARKWMASEKTTQVKGNRVADAFAVKAGRMLANDGVAGLLLPATTLFNIEGKSFRQAFFKEFAVARITNFANLRGNLFGKRAILPTTTLVFRAGGGKHHSSPIIHHGPFAINQAAANADKLWVLTIHGSEIQLIPQSAAVTGETSVWKLALWGTVRDARAMDRLRQLYPLTLTEFCRKRKWGENMPCEGAQLRDPRKTTENLGRCPELKGKKQLNLNAFNKKAGNSFPLHISQEFFEPIPADKCFVRRGLRDIGINKPPHLLIPATWKNFMVYSEDYFTIPPRQMGISALKEDAETLRALTIYLASSLVDYFVFFQVPEWGVYSTFPHVALRSVRTIPTPDFTVKQVDILAKLHRQLLNKEQAEEQAFHMEPNDISSTVEKQRHIDKT